MKAEDIKPGMWLRWHGATVRADHVVPSVTGDRYVCCVSELNGSRCNVVVEALEPWTPRVGEWVHTSVRDGAWRVAKVDAGRGVAGAAFAVLGDSRAADWFGFSLLWPCLPPKAVEAELLEQLAAGALNTRGVYPPPPKPCDCPRCTGPVATLLCMPCQGPGWRDAEPEVRELWVGFRREKRPGETGIRDVLSASRPGAERWWQASGRGHTENHPIREEAIWLWREAVR